jgi:hypothetical protein
VPIHKTVLGGEQYLPFALNKLRQLVAETARRGGYGSRSFLIGSVQIDLRVVGKQHYLSIVDGAGYFDFCFTSPALQKKGYELLGHVIRVSYTGSTLKARRVGSNITLPDGAPETRFDADKSLASFFPLKFFQVDGLIEPRFHPKTRKDWQVMYSWGASTQFSRMLNMSLAGPYLGYQAFDIAYDLQPSNWKTRTQGVAKRSRPQSDFYRSSAVATVDGTSFMLMVDTHNTLHVWSHGQELLEGAQSTPRGEATVASYTSRQLPLPAWAEQSGIWRNLPLVDGFPQIPASGYPHYKWEFDSTGLRLVAVVPEDLGDMSPVYTGVSPAPGTAQQFKDADDENLRVVMLGMVEFILTITPNADDPLLAPGVSIALGRAIRPSTDGRYILAAAYGWDMGNEAVSQDDLLVIEQQIYIKPPDAIEPDRYFVTAVTAPPDWERLSDGCHETRYLIKNEQKATVIRNFCMRKLIQKAIDSPAPYERIEMITSMLALDLKTLSYAFETMIRRMSSDELAPQDETRSLYSSFKTPRKRRAYHNDGVVYSDSVGEDVYALTAPEIDTADKLYDAHFVDSAPAGTLLAPNETTTVGVDEDGFGELLLGSLVGGLEGLTQYTPAQESIAKACRTRTIHSTYITWDSFPFGAIEHGYGAALMWPDPWGGFVCHPEGHFSLCLGPFEAYPDEVSSAVPVDASKLVFSFIDIFRFKTGADTQILTTNLALANQACGTAHTEQEFFDQASFVSPPASPNFAFVTAGMQFNYILDGEPATLPDGLSRFGISPLSSRSLRGLGVYGHQSNWRSSPRKHPMWVGNFNKKLLAAGWGNEPA